MSHPILRHLSILMLALLLFDCGKSRHEALFADLDDRITENPGAAYTYIETLAENDSLIGKMSAHDCARLNLLRIKAADKAYVPHTSDSLIKHGVLDYYDSHTRAKEYPEALYYAGRVYSDLGDSPTALRYFQSAIDALPETLEDKSLKTRILSQTGRKLNSLRLYEQAVPYLEEVLRLEEKDSLSKNYVYNLELLGAIHLHAGQNDLADSLFTRALHFSRNKWTSLEARQNMYLAGLRMKEGNIEEAVSLIRNVPQKVTDDYLGTALGYAADIYLKAEKPDTAYMYAKMLAEDSSFNNQKNGYYILLSSKLIDRLPKDSLPLMVSRYADVIEKFVSKNGDQYALMQNAAYNYSKHDRERMVAEKKSSILKTVIIIILVITLCLVLLSYQQRMRAKNAELLLYRTREEFDAFRESASKPENIMAEYDKILTQSISPAYKEAQEKMRKHLLEKYGNIEKNLPVSTDLIQTEDYEKIMEVLKNKLILQDCDPLWGEMENCITKVSPNFFKTLNLLTGHKPKLENLRLAILLKLGLSSERSAGLLCIQKSTLTARRKKLSSSLFGTHLDYRLLNNIIRDM